MIEIRLLGRLRAEEAPGKPAKSTNSQTADLSWAYSCLFGCYAVNLFSNCFEKKMIKWIEFMVPSAFHQPANQLITCVMMCNKAD